jgi:hypothetical protein
MVRVRFVTKVLSACQHTLCLAQPRRICPIWHGVSRDVLKDVV